MEGLLWEKQRGRGERKKGRVKGKVVSGGGDWRQWGKWKTKVWEGRLWGRGMEEADEKEPAGRQAGPQAEKGSPAFPSQVLLFTEQSSFLSRNAASAFLAFSGLFWPDCIHTRLQRTSQAAAGEDSAGASNATYSPASLPVDASILGTTLFPAVIFSAF